MTVKVKPRNQVKLVGCMLCDDGLLDGELCPDCDGQGVIEHGSDLHAQQLKLERCKKRPGVAS